MRRLGYSTGLPASQVDFLATIDITQADAAGNVTRPGVTVGGVCHGIALVVQMHTQQLGDVGIVFDDQYAFGGFHVGGLSPDMAAGVITIN